MADPTAPISSESQPGRLTDVPVDQVERDPVLDDTGMWPQLPPYVPPKANVKEIGEAVAAICVVLDGRSMSDVNKIMKGVALLLSNPYEGEDMLLEESKKFIEQHAVGIFR